MHRSFLPHMGSSSFFYYSKCKCIGRLTFMSSGLRIWLFLICEGQSCKITIIIFLPKIFCLFLMQDEEKERSPPLLPQFGKIIFYWAPDISCKYHGRKQDVSPTQQLRGPRQQRCLAPCNAHTILFQPCHFISAVVLSSSFASPI